jgi:hypothetical protein
MESAFKRLKDLRCEDSLAYLFAKESIPSATLAYGIPMISAPEFEEGEISILFEWKKCFWIFKSNGNEVTITPDDDTNKTILLTREDLTPFIKDYTSLLPGMPILGNQSEFKK